MTSVDPDVTAVCPKPKGPPPLVMTATFGNRDEDRAPYVQIEVTHLQPVERTSVNNATGEKTSRTVLVPVTTVTRHLVDNPGMTLYSTDGKKVPRTDVPKLLAKPSPVLVSSDGEKVDPFYLKMAREGTVVIVNPELARSLARPAR